MALKVHNSSKLALRDSQQQKPWINTVQKRNVCGRDTMNVTKSNLQANANEQRNGYTVSNAAT